MVLKEKISLKKFLFTYLAFSFYELVLVSGDPELLVLSSGACNKIFSVYLNNILLVPIASRQIDIKVLLYSQVD